MRPFFFFSGVSCTHRQVRGRRLFPGANPPTLKSDTKVRGTFAQKSYGFFVVFSSFLFILFLISENANPFTFVGYLFIGFPVFRFFPHGMGL